MPKLKKILKEWKNKDPKEQVCFGLGLLFLALAVIGIFIPILPQVPFAIAAAFFFSKGSRRLHKWIRKNKFLGQPVRDWEDHQVLRPKLKVISTLAMVGGAVMGHMKMLPIPAMILDAIFLACITFVLTRDSKPPRHAHARA